jgi:hypothetical protein
MPGLDPCLCTLEKEPLQTLVLESLDYGVSVACNGTGYKWPNLDGQLRIARRGQIVSWTLLFGALSSLKIFRPSSSVFHKFRDCGNNGDVAGLCVSLDSGESCIYES